MKRKTNSKNLYELPAIAISTEMNNWLSIVSTTSGLSIENIVKLLIKEKMLSNSPLIIPTIKTKVS